MSAMCNVCSLTIYMLREKPTFNTNTRVYVHAQMVEKVLLCVAYVDL